MTGPAPRRVFLDACVLYPPLVRCLLLETAAQGLIAPFWSPRVLEEWARAAARNHDAAAMRAARAEAASMDLRWPGATIAPDDPPLALSLPDPDDEHVLGAALAAGADLLATFNLRDFPNRKLRGLGVTALHPDALLWEFAGGAPGHVGAAIRKTLLRFPEATRRESPARMLKRAGLPRLAKLLRNDADLARMAAAGAGAIRR